MKNQDKINKDILNYYKRFPWRKTLVVIKQRCTNPNNKSYKDYGGRGIKCLITENQLRELWYFDKAYEMKQPTIDRIKNDNNYTFKNCRYIEKRLNSAERNKRVSSIPILQYDLNGKFINEWESLIFASKTLKINHSNICQCCKSNKPNAGNFIWRYKNEN